MNAVTLRLLVGLYFSEVKIESESERAGATHLEGLGLVTILPNSWNCEITEKGRVHVNALLDAPLPTQIWKSPLCSN